MDKLTVSKNLRALRIKNKFRQRHIAEILKIDRSTYAYYETGRTVPNILTLKILADFYEVSLDGLLNPDLTEVI